MIYKALYGSIYKEEGRQKQYASPGILNGVGEVTDTK